MSVLDFIRKLTQDKAPQRSQVSMAMSRLPLYTQPRDVVVNTGQSQLRQPEDAGFVPGQQGLVRMNADVAHFPMQPQGRPEDAGLVMGPQGYAPMNADIAHPMGQMQPFGASPEDAYAPAQYAQPTSYNSGQVGLNGAFIQGGFAASPQNPYRRIRSR